MVTEKHIFSQADIIYGTGEEEKDACISARRRVIEPRFEHVFGDSGKGIGIDDVREMHRVAYLAPGGGNQLFILNHADSMTREAAHALLKILEEPPRSAYFILVASSLAGIPLTLQSRLAKHRILKKTFSPQVKKTKLRQIGTQEEAVQFFTSEISKLKEVLEKDPCGMPRVRDQLRQCIRSTVLLATSRVAPSYIVEDYMLRYD